MAKNKRAITLQAIYFTQLNVFEEEYSSLTYVLQIRMLTCLQQNRKHAVCGCHTCSLHVLHNCKVARVAQPYWQHKTIDLNHLMHCSTPYTARKKLHALSNDTTIASRRY